MHRAQREPTVSRPVSRRHRSRNTRFSPRVGWRMGEDGPMVSGSAPEVGRGDGHVADFLHSLSATEAAGLAARAVFRSFVRGQTLCHQGQFADRVMILRSGRVKITATTPSGREVVLAFRGPGELVGELSALDGAPRSATVTALEPVELIALTPGDFLAFVSSHPSVVAGLLGVLSRRLRDADAKRIEFAAFDSLGRV